MKRLLFVHLALFYIALPTLTSAADLSHNHLFSTTYANGSSQEGSWSVGKSKNCLLTELPPNELAKETELGSRNRGTENDAMIFCEEPELLMTILNKEEKTYHAIDMATVQAIQEQRNQMMRQMGIAPGSGEERELFKSFGDRMNKMRQQQRLQMEQALKNEDMSPEERAQAEAYINKRFPKTQSSNSMEVTVEVTDLRKHDTQNGISCNWYRVEMSGLVNDIHRVCAAAWSDIPGGQRTKDLMYAFMNFMKDMSKGMPRQHNVYEVMKKIDGFRLISIKEDRNGNVVSEERYLGTKETKVSYTPPADYALEDMGGMMSRSNHRRSRQIIPPPINQTKPPATAQGDDPVDDSAHRNQNPEEMKKRVGDLFKGMGLGDLLRK